MKSFRVVRFMSGWSVQRKGFFKWHNIKHGDFWNAAAEKERGKVIIWDTEQEARDWLKKVLFIKDPCHEHE